MTDRELLQQAMEALELWDSLIRHQYTGSPEVMSAITVADAHGSRTIDAIRSRLVEHERDILRADKAKLAREAHTWSQAAETYAADAERFRWLAERTVATGLARWVHPFQFLAEAVDKRRQAETIGASPRVTTAAELRQQAKSDTSCVGAFARARPGKA